MLYSAQSLKSLVEQHLGWLEDSYGIAIESASDRSVDLKGADVVLRILFSSDLPQLILLSKRNDGEFDGFDLWEFLAVARRSDVSACFKKISETANIAQRNELMLGIYSCALRVAGRDILEGDESWKEHYVGIPDKMSR